MTSVEPKTVRPVISNPKSAKKASKKSVKKAVPKGKKSSAAELKAAREQRERQQDALLIQPQLKPTENPCKPGSFCYAQVQAAVTSRTVADAKQKLAANKENPTPERAIEVGWMVKKGYIKVAEA